MTPWGGEGRWLDRGKEGIERHGEGRDSVEQKQQDPGLGPCMQRVLDPAAVPAPVKNGAGDLETCCKKMEHKSSGGEVISPGRV